MVAIGASDFGSMTVIWACSGVYRLMIAWPTAARVLVFPQPWRPITDRFGVLRNGRATGASPLSPMAKGRFNGSDAAGVVANASMTWPA